MTETATCQPSDVLGGSNSSTGWPDSSIRQSSFSTQCSGGMKRQITFQPACINRRIKQMPVCSAMVAADQNAVVHVILPRVGSEA